MKEEEADALRSELKALGKKVSASDATITETLGRLVEDLSRHVSTAGRMQTIGEQLRKREAEARVFLALMRLLDEGGSGAGRFLDYPAGMPAKDERAAVTERGSRAVRPTAAPSRSTSAPSSCGTGTGRRGARRSSSPTSPTRKRPGSVSASRPSGAGSSPTSRRPRAT